MAETLTLVAGGEGRVTGISLPKNPDSPSRKVTLNNGQSAWIFEDQLGELKAGDLVTYEIKKNAENFKKFTLLAPVTTQKGSGGAEAQTPTAAPPPVQGRGDAVGGGGSGPSPAAERDVANEDTARFESWAFVANVGMVELAFAELLDAYNGGDLDEITPGMLEAISRRLINAADQVQRSLVGRTDRGAQSHVRARGVVRTALLKHPLRAQLADIDAWAADIQKTATRLLQLAASL